MMESVYMVLFCVFFSTTFGAPADVAGPWDSNLNFLKIQQCPFPFKDLSLYNPEAKESTVLGVCDSNDTVQNIGKEAAAFRAELCRNFSTLSVEVCFKKKDITPESVSHYLDSEFKEKNVCEIVSHMPAAVESEKDYIALLRNATICGSICDGSWEPVCKLTASTLCYLKDCSTGERPDGSGQGNGTQAPPANGSGQGNGTQAPPANGNGQGNGTQAPPANGNGQGNITLPPANGNGQGNITLPPANGNGQGNITLPPANGNGQGNITPPPANDGSGQGSGLLPPAKGNGQGNGTLAPPANGNVQGNGTPPLANGKDQDNITPSPANGNGQGNITPPPANGGSGQGSGTPARPATKDNDVDSDTVNQSSTSPPTEPPSDSTPWEDYNDDDSQKEHWREGDQDEGEEPNPLEGEEGANKNNAYPSEGEELNPLGGKEEANKNNANPSEGESFDQSGTSLNTKPYDDEPSSSHFLAYFLTAVVICISGYVIYHNKQKIMAFIVEGRSNERGKRQRSKDVKYTQLKSNVEEVIPSLEKTATAKNYVY